MAYGASKDPWLELLEETRKREEKERKAREAAQKAAVEDPFSAKAILGTDAPDVPDGLGTAQARPPIRTDFSIRELDLPEETKRDLYARMSPAERMADLMKAPPSRGAANTFDERFSDENMEDAPDTYGGKLSAGLQSSFSRGALGLGVAPARLVSDFTGIEGPEKAVDALGKAVFGEKAGDIYDDLGEYSRDITGIKGGKEGVLDEYKRGNQWEALKNMSLIGTSAAAEMVPSLAVGGVAARGAAAAMGGAERAEKAAAILYRTGALSKLPTASAGQAKRIASLYAISKAPSAAGYVAGVGSMIAGQVSDVYRDAEAAGESPWSARGDAALYGGASMVLNAIGLKALGFDKLMNKVVAQTSFKTAAKVLPGATEKAESGLLKAFHAAKAGRIGRAAAGGTGEMLTETAEQWTEWQVRAPWDDSLRDQSMSDQLVDAAIGGLSAGLLFGGASPASADSSYAMERNVSEETLARTKAFKENQAIEEEAFKKNQATEEAMVRAQEYSLNQAFEDEGIDPVDAGRIRGALSKTSGGDGPNKGGHRPGDITDPFYEMQDVAAHEALAQQAIDLGAAIEAGDTTPAVAITSFLGKANDTMAFLKTRLDIPSELVALARGEQATGQLTLPKDIQEETEFMETLKEVYKDAQVSESYRLAQLEMSGESVRMAFREAGAEKAAAEGVLQSRGLDPAAWNIRKLPGNKVDVPIDPQMNLFGENKTEKQEVGARFGAYPQEGAQAPEALRTTVASSPVDEMFSGETKNTMNDFQIVQEAVRRHSRIVRSRVATGLDVLANVTKSPLVAFHKDQVANDVQTEKAAAQQESWDKGADKPGREERAIAADKELFRPLSVTLKKIFPDDMQLRQAMRAAPGNPTILSLWEEFGRPEAATDKSRALLSNVAKKLGEVPGIDPGLLSAVEDAAASPEESAVMILPKALEALFDTGTAEDMRQALANDPAPLLEALMVSSKNVSPRGIGAVAPGARSISSRHLAVAEPSGGLEPDTGIWRQVKDNRWSRRSYEAAEELASDLEQAGLQGDAFSEAWGRAVSEVMGGDVIPRAPVVLEKIFDEYYQSGQNSPTAEALFQSDATWQSSVPKAAFEDLSTLYLQGIADSQTTIDLFKVLGKDDLHGELWIEAELSRTVTVGDETRTMAEVITEMLSDPDASGREVREIALKLGVGGPISLKLLNLASIAAGKKDVLVLDEVMAGKLFGAEGSEDSLLSTMLHGPQGMLLNRMAEDTLSSAMLHNGLSETHANHLSDLNFLLWSKEPARLEANEEVFQENRGAAIAATLRGIVSATSAREGDTLSERPSRASAGNRVRFPRRSGIWESVSEFLEPQIAFSSRPRSAYEFTLALREAGYAANDARLATEFLLGIKEVTGIKDDAEFFARYMRSFELHREGSMHGDLEYGGFVRDFPVSIPGMDLSEWDIKEFPGNKYKNNVGTMMVLTHGSSPRTLMHELGHVLRFAMPPKDMEVAWREMGIPADKAAEYAHKNYRPSSEHEEIWAHVLEQYLYTGGMKTSKLMRNALEPAARGYRKMYSTIMDAADYGEGKRFGFLPASNEAMNYMELVLASGMNKNLPGVRQIKDAYEAARERFNQNVKDQSRHVYELPERMSALLNRAWAKEPSVSEVVKGQTKRLDAKENKGLTAYRSGFSVADQVLHGLPPDVKAHTRDGLRRSWSLKDIPPEDTITIPRDEMGTMLFSGIERVGKDHTVSVNDESVLITRNFDEALVHQVDGRAEVKRLVEEYDAKGKYAIDEFILKPEEEMSDLGAIRKNLLEGTDPEAKPLDNISTIVGNAEKHMWGWAAVKDTWSTFYRSWVDASEHVDSMAVKQGWGDLSRKLLASRSAAESARHVINRGTKLWDDIAGHFVSTGKSLAAIIGGRSPEFVRNLEALAVAHREVGIYEEVVHVDPEVGKKMQQWGDRNIALEKAFQLAKTKGDSKAAREAMDRIVLHKKAAPEGDLISQFYNAYMKDPGGFRDRYYRAKATMAQIEASVSPEEYGEIRDGVRELTDWAQRAIMDRHLEIGSISKEEYEKINTRRIQRGGTYIPFHRVWAHATSTDVRMITGDLGEGIISPLAALVRKAQMTNQWADHQLAVNAFHEVAKIDEALPPDQRVMPEVRIYREGETAPAPILQKYERLTAYEDGHVVQLYVPRDIYDALGKHEWAGANLRVVKAAQVATRVKRAGATLAMAFPVRNFMRDQQQAATNSRWGYRPFQDVTKMMLMAFGKGSWAKDPEVQAYIEEFFRNNGAISGIVETGMPHAHLTINDLMTAVKSPDPALTPDAERAKSKLRSIYSGNAKYNPMAAGKAGLMLLEHWSSKFEQATRVNLFINARRKGATQMEAVEEAREGTIDFKRAGKYGRIANGFYAFLNASIQDPAKVGRMLRADQPVTGKEVGGQGRMGYAVRIGLFITVPSMINLALNADEPEYDDLPEWDKSLFYHLGKTPNKHWVRFPRPLGVLSVAFGYGFEKLVRGLKGKDPNGWEEWNAALVDGTPLQYVVPSKGWFLGVTPDIAKPAAEINTNYDSFRNRDVTPYSQKDVPKELQGQERFGPIQKAISRASTLGIRNEAILSPYQVDHLISGHLATIGRQGSNILNGAIEKGFELAGKQLRAPRLPEAANKAEKALGLIGLRSRRPVGMGSKPNNDFYKFLEQATMGHKAIMDMRKNGQDDGIFKYMKKYPEAAFYSEASKLSGELSDIRAQLKVIQRSDRLTEEEKMDLNLRLNQHAGQRTAMFLDMVRELEPQIAAKLKGME